MSLLPQIGMTELIVLGILALIIVGPKDLPKLMKGVGGFLRQARSLADEFRAGFDQMAREAEMADLRQEIESLKKNNPVSEVKSVVEDTMRRTERMADLKSGTPSAPPAKGQIAEQEQPADRAPDTGKTAAGEPAADKGKAGQAAEQSDAPADGATEAEAPPEAAAPERKTESGA